MTTPTTHTEPSPRRRIRIIVGAALVLLLLSACAASSNEAANSANDAGFWLGLWQGFIAPIAFIVSLFNDSVGIYEVDNNGAWYDFGYIFGISIFFSGSGAGAGSRGRRR